MLAGRVVERFEINGKKVVIRYPRFTDVKDLMEYYNSLIEERAFVGMQKKVSFEKELDWICNMLKNIETKKAVALVLEVDGKVVGMANVTRNKYDSQRHIGKLGIGIRKEFRGIGLGKRLMKAILREAKRILKLKIVTLEVYSPNKVAIRLYKKFGFKEVGRIKGGVDHYGKICDNIIMMKRLE